MDRLGAVQDSEARTGGWHPIRPCFGGGRGAAFADEIAPGRPLLGALGADLLTGHGKGKIIRICRLRGDLCGCQRQGGAVVGDVEFEGGELIGKLSGTIFDVVGFSHEETLSFGGFGSKVRVVSGA